MSRCCSVGELQGKLAGVLVEVIEIGDLVVAIHDRRPQSPPEHGKVLFVHVAGSHVGIPLVHVDLIDDLPQLIGRNLVQRSQAEHPRKCSEVRHLLDHLGVQSEQIGSDRRLRIPRLREARSREEREVGQSVGLLARALLEAEVSDEFHEAFRGIRNLDGPRARFFPARRLGHFSSDPPNATAEIGPTSRKSHGYKQRQGQGVGTTPGSGFGCPAGRPAPVT